MDAPGKQLGPRRRDFPALWLPTRSEARFKGPARMKCPPDNSLWAGVAFVVVCLFSPLVAGAAETGHPRVEFNRDIRPILSANCFFCHGPDPTHREAELRFDRESGIRQAFRAANPVKSEAWRRMTSTDEEERMPPLSSHKVLTPKQMALVRTWIEQGAPWQDHWAFAAPRKGPGERGEGLGIDVLLLKSLKAQGLAFSPEADRERLLRRVTLDLTGLPPTLQEIDDFVSDNRPGAYEKVVDRLLASPHYGERLALGWLDAARYGDSSVFHADGRREMWPWRDWVIRAFNSNMPFDQFTVEQLAGDLLPNASVEQKIATGFNRNNASTDEGGAIPEEYRVEYVVDRVKTTSMVWLGLTMECSQCHDHKYDPISQREYYQFFAYFNQAADPGMQSRKGNQAPLADVPNFARLADVQKLQAQLADLQVRQAARRKAAEPDFQAWLSQAAADANLAIAAPADAVLYAPLDEASGTAVANMALADATKAKQRDGRVQGEVQWAEGKIQGAFQSGGNSHIDLGSAGGFDHADAFSFGAWIKPTRAAEGAVLARMNDKQGHRGYDLFLAQGKVAVHLIHQWPNNAIKVITKRSVVRSDRWQHVLATYDGSGKAAGVRIYVDGKLEPVDIERNKLKGTIRTAKPLNVGRRSEGSVFSGLVDELRIYTRQLGESEILRLADRDPIRPLLQVPAEKRNAQQLEALRAYFLREVDGLSREFAAKIPQTTAVLAEATKPIGTVMVMQDVPQPRMTYILDRGAYDAPKKDQPVEPGIPAALPPLPKDAPANRLGLARWLVDPQHPLTARVAVNRYWQMIFGDGLVRTPEDFGSQGEPPTHPELLDFLAVDFVEHGWDVKRLIKQIVMSQAYRQSSRITPELLARDPDNRLLSRGPRYRLQGELLRDNALAAAGLLNPKIGGPSVRIYQPSGLWEELAIDKGLSTFVQDHGDKLYRRGMYIYWKRSSPPPSMMMFDAPSREKCALRRGRTNTPLQALVAMNDPQFVEAARVLAQRAMHEGGATLPERITYAFRLASGVRPRPATLQLLVKSYEQERAIFKQQPERAAKLLAIGEAPRDKQIDQAEHAAMMIVASMILNLDETLVRL